jgi:outer membrane receptor protein involved in Fe transport
MFFMNATLRAESASTFGDQTDNTFLFPSASLAWQFTELDALKLSFLSFGKLRVSYGEVGVQPARYNTSNLYVSPTYGDEYGGSLALPLYGNGGFVPSSSRGGANLKPERKKEIDCGTDLRFKHDRLSLSATYYSNKTEDVLLDFPIANSRGYGQVYANGAEIENKGMEVDLGMNMFKNRDWNISVNVLYSRVRNKVTNLAGVESIDLGGLAAVSSRAVEGYPIGVLWDHIHFLGIANY